MSETKRKRARKPQAKPQQYVAYTPNREYNGKTCGIRFFNGVGLIAPHTIDSFLGWSVEDVVQKMKDDFGYDVQPVNEEVTA